MLNNNTNFINLNNTLHELLLKIRNLTSSEGGTIYLKDENFLKFSIFQNDSLSLIKINQIQKDNEFLKLPLENRQYIAVESFLSCSVIKINNIYEEKRFDVNGVKSFDTKFDYKTNSMITIPLIDSKRKESIGVLQLVNKIKDNKFVRYDDLDVERIKIASDFMSYSLSETIQYRKNLVKKEEVINCIINDEDCEKTNKDRLDYLYGDINYIGILLNSISQQCRDLLCELSFNNSYLSSKNNDAESNELLVEDRFIIQSLSSVMSDFEAAYEKQIASLFKIDDAFKISFKLFNKHIVDNNIKIIQNIDNNIIIYGEINIIIQIIILILQNSLNLFKLKKTKKPFIKIYVTTANEEIAIIFENNVNEIDEKLSLSSSPSINDELSKDLNITLNNIRTLLKSKYTGKIFTNNMDSGLMIKIILNNKLSGIINE